MFFAIIKWSAIIYGIMWIIRWFLRRKWGSVDLKNEISAKGKIVLITGASAGIGKAAALEFAKRDALVILACRNLDKAARAVTWIRSQTLKGQLICMKLDLESLDSVRKFANNFKAKYDRLDILVNNAGVVIMPQQNKKTSDGFEIHMGVNHLGHFLLTNLLLDRIKKASPSRIINVSSMAHSWASFHVDDLMSEKHKPMNKSVFNPSELYCRSKMANVLFTWELANRLKGTGVTSYSLCPGVVFTDIGRDSAKETLGWKIHLTNMLLPLFKFFFKTPAEGAATIMYCALSKSLIHESGHMYSNCKFWDPATRAPVMNDEAKKLWEESAKLVDL